MLESTRRIDTVVLDKTGTVTEGRMSLVEVITGGSTTREEVLKLAGALEAASEHPIARAIADAASAQGELPAPESFENVEGLGVQGVVDGPAVVVGRPSLLADWGLALDETLAEAQREAAASGRTSIAVGWDGAARAVLVVADTIK